MRYTTFPNHPLPNSSVTKIIRYQNHPLPISTRSPASVTMIGNLRPYSDEKIHLADINIQI